MSSAISAVGTYGLMLLLAGIGVLKTADNTTILVTGFVIAWPLYVIIYVVWSFVAYSRLGGAALRETSRADAEVERTLFSRFLGLTGTTNTTVAAAAVAVIVTVMLAQQSEIRSQPVDLGLTLLTVACSWLLMMFAFAQRYLRLSSTGEPGEHVRFHLDGPPAFNDHVTLAVALSVMAATTPAEIRSRTAWRVARMNMIIAFVFNSVIVAMIVSLLFGAISA